MHKLAPWHLSILIVKSPAASKLPQVAMVLAALLTPGAIHAQPSPFTAPGRIEGQSGTMSIGSAASGTVKDVFVREWSHVRAGDLLLTLDCRPLEAELQARSAQSSAAEAAFERVRNGPRPDEIAVGEAAVGFSHARADEAQKAFERALALQEGFTITTARKLEAQRDARVTAAHLAEARAKLALLRAGSRREDVMEAEAKRNAAAAEVEAVRARLEQCSIRAPVNGTVVSVLANPGQFLSLAVPAPLLQMLPESVLRVRAEIDQRDLARVCENQPATVTTEAFPNASIRAEVESISPVLIPRTIVVAGAGKDVEVVILKMERVDLRLPIGMPVIVRFGACPSRS
jgi:multidrug resistance efflux pump